MAHGLVMNGGVLHASEVLSEDEFAAALDGYAFYGQHKAVSVFRDAAACLQRANADELDTREAELDATYADVIGGDAALEAAFKKHLLAHPELYADV
ncbi:MAG: hypothetical protein OXU20_24365 [Myxococcales bacterium]|nr:hypothetical protein [Myxococcales bacterium]MDD9967016.1 hypothetical protein [Myxococcales bacterium]